VEYAYAAIALAFLAQYLTGMLLVRRLIASASPAPCGGENAVYESEFITVPATVGWLHPRILLPPEWHEWDLEKLDAVLAHEGAHVRRRDTLTALFARVNRCIFWFHPLAWMLERRLALLAEQACDESSVAALGDRTRYAHLLLEMASVVDGSHGRLQYHALTMASRSHIRQRIESLLQDGRIFSPGLTRASWLALVLCGIPVVWSAGAVDLESQTVKESPKFEVASVKPIPGDVMETRPTRSGGRFIWTTDLSYLISYAYHLDFNHISGAIPDQAHAPIVRVEATFDPAATEDQVRQMLLSLLKDRYRMVAHSVTKDSDGYALTIGKSGLKVKAAATDEPPPPLPQWVRDGSVPALEGSIFATQPEANVVAVTGRRVTITQLIDTLRRLQTKTVWDQTGLSGNYYFAFRYARDAGADADAPALDTALRESLGLELRKTRGPVEMLVVDSMENRPSEN
jgi:uncharacterized protein (TIGR03435 family)